jgi:hypothetical protein
VLDGASDRAYHLRDQACHQRLRSRAVEERSRPGCGGSSYHRFAEARRLSLDCCARNKDRLRGRGLRACEIDVVILTFHSCFILAWRRREYPAVSRSYCSPVRLGLQCDCRLYLAQPRISKVENNANCCNVHCQAKCGPHIQRRFQLTTTAHREC